MNEFSELKKARVTKNHLYKKDGVPYQDKGKGYYHSIDWDNGDRASYRSLQDVQTDFVAGQETEYYLLENGVFDDGKKKYKVFTPQQKADEERKAIEKANRPAYGGGGGKGGWQPKTTQEAKRDITSMTMRYAVDLWVADKAGREDLREIYKELTQYVWDMMDELEATNAGGTKS